LFLSYLILSKKTSSCRILDLTSFMVVVSFQAIITHLLFDKSTKFGDHNVDFFNGHLFLFYTNKIGSAV